MEWLGTGRGCRAELFALCREQLFFVGPMEPAGLEVLYCDGTAKARPQKCHNDEAKG
jgi:hypothetical protein